MKTIKIFGPPGTGKTTKLMSLVAWEEDNNAVPLEKMGYLSFSRAAREVIMKRMKVSEKELRWFRTIHGACSVYLGLHSAIITPADYESFSEQTGMRISPEDSLDYNWDQDKAPDFNITLRALNLATTSCRDIDSVLREFPVHRNLTRERVTQFSTAWAAFKRKLGRFDYMDMLTKFDAEGGPLPIKVGMLDETQDMSELQWRVVRKMYANVERFYMAGDDDQAIYTFIGGSEYGFLDAPCDKEDVLKKSYRVPLPIGEAADGIIRRVAHRKEKAVEWKMTEGGIYRINHDAMSLPWRSYLDKYEDIMVLARHRAGARKFSDDLKAIGISHLLHGNAVQSWKEAKILYTFLELKAGGSVTPHMALELLEELALETSAIRSLSRKKKVTAEMVPAVDFQSSWIKTFSFNRKKSRRYETLRKLINQQGHQALIQKPKISITTMHGSKGREADCVVIVSDCNNTVRQNTAAPAEIRLSYVSLTRAKRDAVILLPQSQTYITHFFGG